MTIPRIQLINCHKFILLELIVNRGVNYAIMTSTKLVVYVY